MSLLELLIQQPDMKERLDNDACWYLIHEELKAFDCRKGYDANHHHFFNNDFIIANMKVSMLVIDLFFIVQIPGKKHGKSEQAIRETLDKRRSKSAKLLLCFKNCRPGLGWQSGGC